MRQSNGVIEAKPIEPKGARGHDAEESSDEVAAQQDAIGKEQPLSGQQELPAQRIAADSYQLYRHRYGHPGQKRRGLERTQLCEQMLEA